MRVHRRAAILICLTATMVVAAGRAADAHGVVGRRMFIEPLTAEDANVKNELGLPRGDFIHLPDGTTRTIGISLEKALYPGRLSIAVETGRIHRRDPVASGWDNVELGVKWEAWKSAAHEFALSPAVSLELPTGSATVADREKSIEPMLLVAKGFGDVGAAWVRPFAVQGNAGYERSLGRSDRQLVYDGVLMYSLPYLNHWVRGADRGVEVEEGLRRGLSWGSLWGNLFPFVEFNARRPLGSGEDRSLLVRSGACWMGKYFQVSVAAETNVHAPACAPRHGVVVLADWFLDEIVPGFGKTPFGHAGDE